MMRSVDGACIIGVENYSEDPRIEVYEYQTGLLRRMGYSLRKFNLEEPSW